MSRCKVDMLLSESGCPGAVRKREVPEFEEGNMCEAVEEPPSSPVLCFKAAAHLLLRAGDGGAVL